MPLFPGEKPFVIAEAGVNHNGSLRRALALVDAAARAGADAVKFQTFKADSLTTGSARKAAYQRRATGAVGSQRDMLRRLELSAADFRALAARCRRRGVEFLSTPFDAASVDVLDRLGMRLIKVPSGEITHRALLAHVASKRRPVLLSTGMSTLAEVAAALKILARGRAPVVLLHCVSSYPTPVEEANVLAVRTLRERFGRPVGYSDHTLGREAAAAAVALGAVVVEKHFTLDRSLRGPDHAMSLTPPELAAFVRSLRDTARALGDGVKAPRRCEKDTLAAARRSLVAARAVPSGARLRAGDLTAKRPGGGISPMDAARVVGRRTRRALRPDETLRWSLVS